jgi:hypothetical protein
MKTIWKVILRILGIHEHYFGVPHEDEPGRIVRTCYECSRTRPFSF